MQCFCGVEGDMPEEISDSCNIPCGGDENEICGGINAISVYKPIVASGGGLGCYADMIADRIFERAETSDDMTAAVGCEYEPTVRTRSSSIYFGFLTVILMQLRRGERRYFVQILSV